MLLKIQDEYLNMPGLQLTLDQAQRLWAIDRTECEALLNALVDAGFLTRTPSGRYARPNHVRSGFRAVSASRRFA